MNQEQTPTEQPTEQPAPEQQQPAACPMCSGGSNTFKILIIVVCLIAAGIITYNNFKSEPTYLPPPDDLPTRRQMRDDAMEQAPAAQAAEKTAEQVKQTAEEAGQAVEAAADKAAEKVEEATAPSNP